MKVLLVVGLVLTVIFSVRDKNSFDRKEKLSDYGFFRGYLSELNPSEGVVPYSVNTPLFSNYAEKLRFVKLPDKKQVIYNYTSVFEFPVGTVFIKNFYFPIDFRNPEKNKKIIETRLLVHQPEGWEAIPYIWNDEQTEAYYDPAGETKTITYTDKVGKKVTVPYVIPNKNQCKGCHIHGQKLIPIGLSARQLNRDYQHNSGPKNQLQYWSESGMISKLPEQQSLPRLAVWNDPHSGSLNERARAYLDVNCGHCHSRLGPAST